MVIIHDCVSLKNLYGGCLIQIDIHTEMQINFILLGRQVKQFTNFPEALMQSQTTAINLPRVNDIYRHHNRL